MPEIQNNETSFRYELRESSRAQRLRLIVNRDGVEAVGPIGVDHQLVHRFVASKATWVVRQQARLRAKLRELPQPEWTDGSELLYLGQPIRLSVGFHERKRPRVEFGVKLTEELTVTLPRGLEPNSRVPATSRAVEAWMKRAAKSAVHDAISRYAPLVGRNPKAVQFRAQKTRWGSCSARGTLSMNWRLIYAPPEVLDYVVVHELCHLRERNHGVEFWGWVERVLPTYRQPRAWLKRHGISLI